MSRVVLTATALDELRKVGDPGLDRVSAADLTPEKLRERPNLLPPTVVPDPHKLALAQSLFGDYTTEISGALLLAALPQSYATAFGAAVLGVHGELQDDFTRRIGRTAQFLLDVMQRGTDAADQLRLWHWKQWDGTEPVTHLPWAVCLRLRCIHQRIRVALKDARRDDRIGKMLGPSNDPPLNQEDLLGMLLTFSFAVFEVLELFGITWTAEEQEAYLHLWDVVGGYLGIGSEPVTRKLNSTYRVPSDWVGLRPPSIDQSRDLLEQIRARQWLDLTRQENVEAWSWSALRSGRVLARALLDVLEEGMPALLKPLPIAVMRALNNDIVRQRLNLGGNGVFLQSLTLLPRREVRIARFTSIRPRRKISGRILRALANEVTARASVHLNEKYTVAFPNAPDWHTTP